jgi:hypothetical protein
LKVTVPDGLDPPDTVAVSFSVAPIAPLAGVGVVAIVGDDFAIVTASSAHALVVVLLFPSPL